MPIAKKDFELACRYLINWPGTGNDGKSLAQRLDERQQPAQEPDGIGEDRVRDMIAWEIQRLPPGLTEDRVKELIAAAILAQQPPPEVDPEPPVEGAPMLLTEDGEPSRLQETSDDSILLTEAAIR